ncbi:MAG: polyisoprenoid-binding protein [Tabrizicola sp.]|nr:polyisoprenoid-binding protein [Tabrizicola sp.]
MMPVPFRFVLAASILLALPASAAPVAYDLERDRSSVTFETDFGPDTITGSIPLDSADLTLDFDRVANSRVSVALDVSGATASFPFAAQALKGPKVLDARAHPQMTFQSTSVQAAGDGAAVDGNLTIRGVTQPVTLRAEIYRQKGTAVGDRSHLTVRLTGKVKRSAFGATGWSDMVSDEVRIIITARIAAKG